ncbi:uncharacterized protein Z518_06737 [Rhinocladiella mackenziei CBS 650.93]|uniref:Purine nucleoside phosphorylase n=1 Tax=Rhinocladiella mackenziei CBS 650.93 TaxID=1442369 RepID=A0A0D2J2M6_9EURO|nr:uncharacterized protein Z518_06737 [Rhinocladiella mackenziei CBS 650.93]KIX03185.1 hypothetical protein Z518_06737 [Rhinocladiella mackenziei CBS 650.93]
MPKATNANLDRYRRTPHLFPIYSVFHQFRDVGAAFTGKGTDPANRHFSFHRPPPVDNDPTEISQHFRANLQQLASAMGFEPGSLLLPNGAWPHSGHAIIAEDEEYTWIENEASGTLMPVVTKTTQVVTYDAIASRSSRHVLAVQGADCPAIFLYDPCARVMGLAHAGWKPLVRNVVGNVLEAMVQLGAHQRNILAYISAGAGDQYNVFKWDEDMEDSVTDVFVQGGRSDLLGDTTIRHEMTAQDCARLQAALGSRQTDTVEEVKATTTSFKLSYLARTELIRCGISESNISCNEESTIVERYLSPDREISGLMKYHSYRRECPHHGLSISVLFLK